MVNSSEILKRMKQRNRDYTKQHERGAGPWEFSDGTEAGSKKVAKLLAKMFKAGTIKRFRTGKSYHYYLEENSMSPSEGMRALAVEGKEITEGPMGDRQAKAKVSLINKRLDMAEKHLAQARRSMRQYEGNPQKYFPQLDNAKNAANEMRSLGRVVYDMVEKLEKMHKY